LARGSIIWRSYTHTLGEFGRIADTNIYIKYNKTLGVSELNKYFREHL